MKEKPVTVRCFRTGKVPWTGKWWAECFSSRLGTMEQWGQTELDALKNLRKFVTDTQGDRWPEVDFEEEDK